MSWWDDQKKKVEDTVQNVVAPGSTSNLANGVWDNIVGGAKTVASNPGNLLLSGGPTPGGALGALGLNAIEGLSQHQSIDPLQPPALPDRNSVIQQVLQGQLDAMKKNQMAGVLGGGGAGFNTTPTASSTLLGL